MRIFSKKKSYLNSNKKYINKENKRHYEKINKYTKISKYKKKKYKTKITSKKVDRKIVILFNLLSLALFIISYYLYFLSLEKCFEGIDICSKKWEWIIVKITQLIISLIIIIFLIILMIYNIISKFHIFHFIFAFICFYYYSHSDAFHDHGAFNLVAYFVILFLVLFLFFILRILILIFRIKYKFFVIFVLLYSYNILVDPMNCDDWAQGLNNTYIENDKDKYGCQIIFPQKCSYKIIGYTQDLSKIFRINCKNKNKHSKEKILKFSKSPYINSNTLKFGFPLKNNEQ